MLAPQAHTMLALTRPPPPHVPSVPPAGGRADKKLPVKEKANNCLSTNKGLPKGEGTHGTNQ